MSPFQYTKSPARRSKKSTPLVFRGDRSAARMQQSLEFSARGVIAYFFLFLFIIAALTTLMCSFLKK
jgi:hypothetical protein